MVTNLDDIDEMVYVVSRSHGHVTRSGMYVCYDADYGRFFRDVVDESCMEYPHREIIFDVSCYGTDHCRVIRKPGMNDDGCCCCSYCEYRMYTDIPPFDSNCETIFYRFVIISPSKRIVSSPCNGIRHVSHLHPHSSIRN